MKEIRSTETNKQKVSEAVSEPHFKIRICLTNTCNMALTTHFVLTALPNFQLASAAVTEKGHCHCSTSAYSPGLQAVRLTEPSPQVSSHKLTLSICVFQSEF